MWVEILCGLIVYKLFRYFFCDGDGDEVLEVVESNDTNALFLVTNRLEKIYGGKAYVGLRIPDPDTASRLNIDMVLVTSGETVVVSVKNFSGFVSITGDGSWVYEGSKGKKERHPDPTLENPRAVKEGNKTLELKKELEEVKKQASVLESYLEQRGVALQDGYLSYKIVLPNPQFRTLHLSDFPSEVITYDQWSQLKPEQSSVFSGWLMGAFRGGKKDKQESMLEKLSSVLSTAPMWDRLELKHNKYVLGEFIEFKGKQEDVLMLKNIKRSKVGRVIIFGLDYSKVQVLYFPRDYRSDAVSASEWKKVTVRSSTEGLFQPESSSKVRKFKLSSVISMSLSA